MNEHRAQACVGHACSTATDPYALSDEAGTCEVSQVTIAAKRKDFKSCGGTEPKTERFPLGGRKGWYSMLIINSDRQKGELQLPRSSWVLAAVTATMLALAVAVALA